MAHAIQEVSNKEVTLAYVDQGYTGQNPANAALEHGIALEVVKLLEAKRGFVLLPRRWVAERSFGWAARFRRLARDYERLPETLAGLHYLAFACLMLPHLADATCLIGSKGLWIRIPERGNPRSPRSGADWQISPSLCGLSGSSAPLTQTPPPNTPTTP